MKRLSSLPAHKMILWTCFIPSLTFVLIYEFFLSTIPSYSDTIFKLGQIFSRICYSMVATSIFYFISQYIGVFIPRHKRKIKILPIIYRNIVTMDVIINQLNKNIGMQWNDIKDNDKLKNALLTINTDSHIENFENWYQYLFHIKSQLSDIIRSITFYHEYLSKDFFHELLIIEKNLMSPITFVGYKVLRVSNLDYARLELQELIIHNQHLQQLRETELKQYQREFDEDGKVYRETYYNSKS